MPCVISSNYLIFGWTLLGYRIGFYKCILTLHFFYFILWITHIFETTFLRKGPIRNLLDELSKYYVSWIIQFKGNRQYLWVGNLYPIRRKSHCIPPMAFSIDKFQDSIQVRTNVMQLFVKYFSNKIFLDTPYLAFW